MVKKGTKLSVETIDSRNVGNPELYFDVGWSA